MIILKKLKNYKMKINLKQIALMIYNNNFMKKKNNCKNHFNSNKYVRIICKCQSKIIKINHSFCLKILITKYQKG